MRNAKALLRSGSIVLVAWLAGQIAVPRARAYETIQTQGRRLWIKQSTQRLVVTDPTRDRVAVYDVSGERPRKLGEFGEQGLDPGQFMGPHGAVLVRGELVVADTFNHRVQSFDAAPLLAGLRPRLTQVWGARGGYARGGLDGPLGPVVNPRSGNVYVADSRHGRVLGFDQGGRPLEPGLGAGQLAFPAALTFDATGRWLYVAEEWGARISIFDVDSGRAVASIGSHDDDPKLSAPAGLALGPDGDLWATDKSAKRVVRLRPRLGADGVPVGLRQVASFGRVGAGAGEWTYPQSLAVDGRGRIYVCDQLDLRCQMFDASGKFLGAFAEDWHPLDWTAPPPQPKGANAKGPHDLCSAAGRYGVRFETRPEPIPLNEPFDLSVDVRAGCAADATAPAELDRLRVDAMMPEHRHGMNTEPRVVRVAPGRFEVRGLLFHMAGIWELHFDVTRDGILERTQYDVRVE